VEAKRGDLYDTLAGFDGANRVFYQGIESPNATTGFPFLTPISANATVVHQNGTQQFWDECLSKWLTNRQVHITRATLVIPAYLSSYITTFQYYPVLSLEMFNGANLEGNDNLLLTGRPELAIGNRQGATIPPNNVFNISFEMDYWFNVFTAFRVFGSRGLGDNTGGLNYCALYFEYDAVMYDNNFKLNK
jgi:hypothetical protein